MTPLASFRSFLWRRLSLGPRFALGIVLAPRIYWYGSSALMAFWSASDTIAPRRSWRLFLRVLLVRMWRRNARLRFTRPLPVTLKRLAAPRLVFLFGIALDLRCSAPAELRA